VTKRTFIVGLLAFFGAGNVVAAAFAQTATRRWCAIMIEARHIMPAYDLNLRGVAATNTWYLDTLEVMLW
jgi:hypothetical protein